MVKTLADRQGLKNKMGWHNLVERGLLPTNLCGYHSVFEGKLGFQIGDENTDNSALSYSSFPKDKGWYHVTSPVDRHVSAICDELDRPRAKVVYNLYNMDVYMEPIPRFTVQLFDLHNNGFRYGVCDSLKPVAQTQRFRRSAEAGKSFGQKYQGACTALLSQCFPDWEDLADPHDYWLLSTRIIREMIRATMEDRTDPLAPWIAEPLELLPQNP